MSKFVTVGVVLLSIIMGCSGIPEEEAAIGGWVANHGKCPDSLFVNADGTYEHRFLSDSGIVINNGTWKPEMIDDRGCIDFINFEFALPGYGSTYRWAPSHWPVEIERTLTGKLRLCLDPDLGYYYEKVRGGRTS